MKKQICRRTRSAIPMKRSETKPKKKNNNILYLLHQNDTMAGPIICINKTLFEYIYFFMYLLHHRRTPHNASGGRKWLCRATRHISRHRARLKALNRTHIRPAAITHTHNAYDNTIVYIYIDVCRYKNHTHTHICEVQKLYVVCVSVCEEHWVYVYKNWRQWKKKRKPIVHWHRQICCCWDFLNEREYNHSFTHSHTHGQCFVVVRAVRWWWVAHFVYYKWFWLSLRRRDDDDTAKYALTDDSCALRSFRIFN